MDHAEPWWSDAVFYRVDVRSFADIDADAIGDLDGLRSRLGYLELLGVDALTLSGTEVRAQQEHVGMLLEECHAAGIRLILDGVTDPAALRYWLDHGVDGFHQDSADQDVATIVAEYSNRVLLGDQVPILGRFAEVGFDADALAEVITAGLATEARVPGWSLISWSARGGSDVLAPTRARAFALVQLAAPGAACLQHGEELGLPGGYRTPMPWEGEHRPFGFSEAIGSWAAIPEHWVHHTVEAQLEDPASTLSLYRQAMELRREHSAFTGADIEWFGAPQGCFAFQRSAGGLICALNTTAQPVPLPPGEVLLCSGSTELTAEGLLPQYTAAWLA